MPITCMQPCQTSTNYYWYWCQTAAVKITMTLHPTVLWWINKGWGQATVLGQCSEFNSVLNHCCLGGRWHPTCKKPKTFIPKVQLKNEWRKKSKGNQPILVQQTYEVQPFFLCVELRCIVKRRWAQKYYWIIRIRRKRFISLQHYSKSTHVCGYNHTQSFNWHCPCQPCIN